MCSRVTVNSMPNPCPTEFLIDDLELVEVGPQLERVRNGGLVVEGPEDVLLGGRLVLAAPDGDGLEAVALQHEEAVLQPPVRHERHPHAPRVRAR